MKWINSILKVVRKRFKMIAVILFFVGPGILTGYSNWTIYNQTKAKTFDSVSEIPKNKVGLVLGTAKLLKNGNLNLYFKYRVAATTELYNSDKIEYVLVSGDNGRSSYDEPTDFKNELIKNGIPAEKIYLDFAGFRTLDSVVRSKEVFGEENVTVISQKFHNERAIYLARGHGMSMVGYNARDVSGRYGLRVKIREYLARVKAFLDLRVGVKPKFLGPKIVIG